jgi:hypothetical protein
MEDFGGIGQAQQLQLELAALPHQLVEQVIKGYFKEALGQTVKP